MFNLLFLSINHEISQIIPLHRRTAMHLITFPGRVHDFRHFWPTTTMSPQPPRKAPNRPRSSSIFSGKRQRVGPCPGPVCNFDMKFLFFFFFLNLRQVFFPTSSKLCDAHVRLYTSMILRSPSRTLLPGISYASNHFMCNLVQIQTMFFPAPPPWHCEFPA